MVAGALTVALCATPALAGCGNTADVAGLNSQIATLQTNNETQAGQIQTLQSQNETLTTENAELIAQNEELSSQSGGQGSQADYMVSVYNEMTSTFKNVFRSMTKLKLKEDAQMTIGFAPLVDRSKTMYVALDTLEQNNTVLVIGDVYKVIITRESADPYEFVFKLSFKNGEYILDYIGDKDGEPSGDRYTFSLNKGKVRAFGIHSNGALTHINDTIHTEFNVDTWVSEDICDGTIVSMSSDGYNGSELLAELQAAIPADHQITITQAEKDALA